MGSPLSHSIARGRAVSSACPPISFLWAPERVWLWIGRRCHRLSSCSDCASPLLPCTHRPLNVPSAAALLLPCVSSRDFFPPEDFVPPRRRKRRSWGSRCQNRPLLCPLPCLSASSASSLTPEEDLSRCRVQKMVMVQRDLRLARAARSSRLLPRPPPSRLLKRSSASLLHHQIPRIRCCSSRVQLASLPVFRVAASPPLTPPSSALLPLVLHILHQASFTYCLPPWLGPRASLHMPDRLSPALRVRLCSRAFSDLAIAPESRRW